MYWNIQKQKKGHLKNSSFLKTDCMYTVVGNLYFMISSKFYFDHPDHF